MEDQNVDYFTNQWLLPTQFKIRSTPGKNDAGSSCLKMGKPRRKLDKQQKPATKIRYPNGGQYDMQLQIDGYCQHKSKTRTHEFSMQLQFQQTGSEELCINRSKGEMGKHGSKPERLPFLLKRSLLGVQAHQNQIKQQLVRLPLRQSTTRSHSCCLSLLWTQMLSPPCFHQSDRQQPPSRPSCSRASQSPKRLGS